MREAWSWGIVDGVTTNPSQVLKTGRRAMDVYTEILDIVDCPVSLETVSLTAPEIIKEAHELAKLHKNVVVKIPLLKEGLKAVKALSAEGIKTNVTTTFSALQALLAAKCGATYVSPFVGRLDYIGGDGMELVQQIKTINVNYGFQTEIIVAAIRHPKHVLDAALIGADICTMYFVFMEMLYTHPLTDVVIDQFLRDYAKIPK
ncbi:MAG TPA: fructose-6-phosphate aldolase [Blastocatellia bacterium]|nr:fructose-6-phosphate aldolase [Blastocatellia bacterium]